MAVGQHLVLRGRSPHRKGCIPRFFDGFCGTAHMTITQHVNNCPNRDMSEIRKICRNYAHFKEQWSNEGGCCGMAVKKVWNFSPEVVSKPTDLIQNELSRYLFAMYAIPKGIFFVKNTGGGA